MGRLDRRAFLSRMTGALVTASGVSLSKLAAPAAAATLAQNPQQYPPYEAKAPALTPGKPCWLDVAAPFVVEDPSLGIHTELLLTATCFPGVQGFRDRQFGTEYEVQLFDGRGREVNLGRNGRMLISAMRPTVLRMSDVLDRGKPFWGSAKIRLAPRGNPVTHAGDLFSAGFIRWNTPSAFDNVHAHPAAPKQARGRFFYSMPFPPLDEFHCAFALFNPSPDDSVGTIRLVHPSGKLLVERRYTLRPHQTFLYDLAGLEQVDSPARALSIGAVPASEVRAGGVVSVTNHTEAVPFAYTLMQGRSGGAFTVEHPLHFADAPVKLARATPYGPSRSFPAEAFLYTPLLFAGRRIGGVEFESRVYLSASRWREEALWVMPFVTDERGDIAWVSNQDDQFPARVEPASACHDGVLRLTEFASCRLDAARLPLAGATFSGGFGVATIPPTSHSLMKVEVRARNWGRTAFTHFRPGGHFHKKYRTVTERGGLATDYIISGCQIRGTAGDRKYDALLAIMNIEFEDKNTARPRLEVFGPGGLIAEKQLGEFPPLACRHLLLSELFPELRTEPGQPLSVRMTDTGAMIVCSVVHLDYERRDLAMDHGSDRHSTYLDYGC
jgi:hypothetical protein